MKEEKVSVTMKDMQRYRVLRDVIEKKLKGSEASELLGLSYVHVSRLKARLKKEGVQGLIRRKPPLPPNKKIAVDVIEEIIRLRKGIYYDFNIMHFRDKLMENHNICLSYESLRQILIENRQHQPKKRRIIHRQRRRMPKAGMLLQMDSSQHRWLEHIAAKYWLIATIDDATNEVPYARFFPQDTVFANMHILRRFVELKGIFMALYADKASHFATTRHGGLHYSVSEEQPDTQIQRALEELGITMISANSPQAKGRIEVTFKLFQDRLIKEMRLARIRDYNEANRFLQEKFLPWYNAKYTHEAESVYMPLPKEKNLDLVFSIKEKRTVGNDNTISYNNQTIQLLPSKIRRSFARLKVDVCLMEDNRILVVYKGKIIAETLLGKDNRIIKMQKKIEKLLDQREYIPVGSSLPVRKSVRTHYKPPRDHPWNKSFSLWIKRREMIKAKKSAQKEVEKLPKSLVEVKK